ncbi:MAG: hypothetical protein JWN25_958, partial [Verrucomicrobiales bacterium]|nr:hypothetical protein [Verrucomicrobiales bacterium]
EVISGSSAGKPEEGDDFSVNAVKVHKDGYIDATHLGWSSAGNWRTPLPIPCTPYDVIRVEEASLPPDADARSLKYTQTWELSLKNGDIKTVEMHRGLRSATRTPLKELKVQTTASAMTAGTLKVEVSEGPQIKDFEIKPNLEDPDGPTFDYFMQFERPLTENDSASIDYKYTYRGVMFRSREDQENFGTKPEEAGHDEVIQEIVRPTEQFLFILRFVSDEGGEKVWYPEKLHLQVLDADGVPCSREERSSHVLFDYTKPDSDALTKSVLVQAILCIHKPRIGFSYKISWKLPENDNMPHESETRVYRRNLLGLSAKPALRARADAFVTECLIKLNELISQEYPLSQQDDSLHSYLFAFGEKSRDLQCRGTTAALNEHLVVTSFEYGFDIIGTAFRRREMMRYPYKTSFGKEMLRKIDEAKVKYLLVFPLNFPNDNGWPVGMLAFASGAGDSPLKEVFLNDSLLARLKLEISEIWKSNVDKLCRYPATA